MNKIYALVLVFVAGCLSLEGQVTLTWNGLGSNNNFTTAANWDLNQTPGASDEVVFNATSSKTCVISTPITVGGFTITSGYTGTISLGSSNVGVNGSFSQDGGTFISSNNTGITSGLSISNSFIHTGGTFVHNNGQVRFILPAGNSSNIITGTTTFSRIRVIHDNFAGHHFLTFGTGITTGRLIINDQATGDPTSIAGSVSVTSILDISGGVATSAPSANTGTIVLSGTANITVNGTTGGDPSTFRLPNIEINTTGDVTINDELNIQGNWIHTAGAIQSNGSIVNMIGTGTISGTAIDGTATNFENLNIVSGASVTIPTGTANLVVSTSFSVGGTVTNLATAGVTFNDVSTLDLAGQSINFLRVLNAGNLTLNSPVIILDSLSLDGAGSLTTNNNLTLTSTPSLKARIGMALGGGAINGDITVHTYVPGGNTGWGVLGTPGVENQTVGHWENPGAPAPNNINLFMTCNDCIYTPSVVGSFTSVQIWDETTAAGFDGNSSTVTPLSPGRGMWFYIGNGSSTTTDITLINTGPAVIGERTVGITSNVNGYVLLANPYTSPISADAFIAMNAGNLNSGVIYAYDADGQSGGNYTAYQTGGGSFPGNPTDITNELPAGQAFFVDAQQTGAMTFTFTEEMKTMNNQGPSLVRTAGANDRVQFKMNLRGATGDFDVTLFRFQYDASMTMDFNDGKKLFTTPGYYGAPQPYSKYTTISSRWMGQDYQINTMPVLSQSVSIPLLVRVYTSGTYTLSMSDLQNFSSCVVLKDKLTGAYHDLYKSDYVFNISDTTSAPRFELLICQDPGSGTTGVKEFSPVKFIQINQDQHGVVVQTQFPEKTKAVISVCNILGQQLIDPVEIEGTETSTRIPANFGNQVLIIKVASDREVATRKIITH